MYITLQDRFVNMSTEIKSSSLELQLLEQCHMERSQLNLRISDQLGKLIDAKRIELAASIGTIPSRSDILRFALEAYLGKDLSEMEVDRRRKARQNESSEQIP